ncbi:uncharacterized protein LOC134665336 [Cydia fagiglandana]|uniref:uncharacterized protein LOC134665336 n=1 Tax=Cydia fagiglandana TaxID=1458189 RepID=UPI002FEDF30A
MAANDRVVFPDEVEDVKAKAAEVAAKSGAGDSNSVEEAPQETTPTIAMRNMIQVPDNCPEGYKMDANGVCREVW